MHQVHAVSMRKSSELKNMYDSPRFDAGRRSRKRVNKRRNHEEIRRARKQAEFWKRYTINLSDEVENLNEEG